MSRRVQIALSGLFLIVAIVATVNMYQFNTYARKTMQRDHSQEQCQRETLVALRLWSQQRIAVETAYDLRDEANAAVIADVVAGVPVTPEHAQRMAAAISEAREARAALQESAREHPVPTCSLG